MPDTPRNTTPNAEGEPPEDTDENFAAAHRVADEDTTEFFGRTVLFYPDVSDSTVLFSALVIGIDDNGKFDLFVPGLLTVNEEDPGDNDAGLRLRIGEALSQGAGTPGYTLQGSPLGPSLP